ncbi:MAG: valine--tRNA ligase [Methanomassiliicoccales archaeon]|nr:valine--tRNA ligase [Methanomassiliicoccales archaeon]
MSQYEAIPTERKWQKQWKDWELYKFEMDSDRPVYSIDNPPRYASGALHLGHATGYSLIDFAARYHRQRGYNVMFPLCFDVNGTPVEVRVEKKFGINKYSVPRQKYIEMCEEYANSFIESMKAQFEILGESMDPSVYYQTDAPYYRRITQITFIKMLEKGLAYKGEYPVNWCPRCITALADAEVEYDQNVTKLNYVKFPLADLDENIIIATTRPELICTCQTIAVHPNDARYAELVGQYVITPVFGKKVKVIADEKVDPAFGSGIVMICTIGDKTDLEWVMKYKLPLDKGIDEEGRMTAIAGPYEGMPVKDARAKIIKDLLAQGLIVKQEEQVQNRSICWRCHAPIEFLQVKQWFLKTMPFKEQVLAKADEIKWFPEFMKVRLQDWVNSLQWDWVLSRQRYFATPIPVWECQNCDFVLPAKEEDCYMDPTVKNPYLEKCPMCGGELKGCPDVFDTWMDSSVSPLYNTFWKRDEEKFKKLYPMSLRPQSHDIIRTWAFYTILREYLLTDEKPWEHIMIHGFIMAPDGTPMHTSIGNVIDPMPLLESYGTDALRYYACTCTLGEDHAFRERDVVHGKKLCTKIWNLGKLIEMTVTERPERVQLKPIDRWIMSRYTKVLETVTGHLDNYNFDKAMREVENFAWKEFADHYVEMTKHRTRTNDKSVRYTLYTVYLGILKMMAPMLPHVTEDAYQAFAAMDDSKSIHISKWPEPEHIDEEAEVKGELTKDIIAAVRTWKAEKKYPLNKELLNVEIVGKGALALKGYEQDIAMTVRAGRVEVLEKVQLNECPIQVKPVHAKIGPLFKNLARDVVAQIAAIEPETAMRKLAEGGFEVTLDNGRSVLITSDLVEVVCELQFKGKSVETIQVRDLLVVIEVK